MQIVCQIPGNGTSTALIKNAGGDQIVASIGAGLGAGSVAAGEVLLTAGEVPDIHFTAAGGHSYVTVVVWFIPQ